MYLYLSTISVFADEYQDIYSDLIEFFTDTSEVSNTGLTTFPVLEVNPGGERSNLGNAYTALARDVSFFDANPAASALLSQTELAFFHRNLISDVSMDSAYFTRRNENLGYGLGVKYLHFEFTAVDSRGNQIASANPAEVVLTANGSYNFFDNYVFSGVALGINLKLAYRIVPSSLYENVLDPSAYNQNLFGYMADLGLLSRFNFLKMFASREKNFSVGVAVKNLGPAVKGDPLPTVISSGLSYQPFSFLLISSDLNIPINLVDPSSSEAIGWGVGLDVRVVDFFSLQSGFEWRGYNPRLTMGGNVDLEPVSFLINYTLDMTTSSSGVDNFSITASLDFGDEGRKKIQERVDEIYISALIALSNGEFERVIELCDLIIDRETGLDPSFTPAIRTREVARVTLLREQQFVDFEQNRDSSTESTTEDPTSTDGASSSDNSTDN